MSRTGLNKEKIVAKASELIEKSGKPGVSMRELAEALDVKTPSLYNHISGMEELNLEIARRAVAALDEAQFSAISEKREDEAVRALANAYRTFGREHSGLYDTVMSLPSSNDSALEEVAAAAIDPIMRVLDDFDLSQEQKMHWQRVLRSFMHGFISQEKAGFFSHFPTDSNTSYETAINCFLTGLHAKIGGGSYENE